MNDDDKADLARQGVRAAELLEPGKIRERVTDAVTDAAEDAALRGLAAVGRLTGKDRSPARSRAVAAVDLNDALAEWDVADVADFERRVHRAAARKAREAQEVIEARPAEERRRLDLAEIRRSFPEPSRELALLVFNCVDLLEDLSADAEGQPPSAEQLERKEQLLTRLAELLAPDAGEALRSFVAHVVSLSRQAR